MPARMPVFANHSDLSLVRIVIFSLYSGSSHPRPIFIILVTLEGCVGKSPIWYFVNNSRFVIWGCLLITLILFQVWDTPVVLLSWFVTRILPIMDTPYEYRPQRPNSTHMRLIGKVFCSEARKDTVFFSLLSRPLLYGTQSPYFQLFLCFSVLKEILFFNYLFSRYLCANILIKRVFLYYFLYLDLKSTKLRSFNPI